MSANRSRMTYGSPQYAPQEAAARNELFAGAPQVQQQLGGPGTAGGYGARGPVVKEDLQYMGNRQIMDYAVDQHKDTTATARRALQVVEQTKELQATTMTSLQDQGQQMRRVAAGMDKIGSDLTYSQRILRYMRMCCCVGFFCSSCVEPEREVEDRNWRANAQQPPPRGPPPGYAGAAQRAPPPPAAAAAKPVRRPGQHGGGVPQQQAEYPPVATSGLEKAGYGEHAAVIKTETAQQDQYLDQIAMGLEQLKHGAMAMNEEMGRQDQNVNRLHNDAHLLHSRLNSVNKEGFKF